ncbi:MAG: AAA family ATPase [Calothrix sp. FI2-JRJ7]|jgi:tetratricopeptide (TPR) repeat protein|nr:AAA family ATPase [Calothrix sp. FI2-JRJ7]
MVFSATEYSENPYIIGRPIYEPEFFFGREELFNFIKDNLNQKVQVILLHGQRRIGKTSVLSQIPNFVCLDNFEFVLLSLEGKSQKLLYEVLYELSEDIFDYFDFTKEQVKLPTKEALREDKLIFFDVFLPQVYQALGNKNLVLLLDEFDVLGDSHSDSAVTHFFPFLLSVIQRQPQLYIIPVVGRRLDDMPNLLSLFRQAPTQEIGLLDTTNAERLITKPANSTLIYEPDAINAILELSAGHPYFTQVLCFALFSHAREKQQPHITRADVYNIINQAIEIGEAGLTWFRDGLPIPERVIFSTVAEMQQEKSKSAVLQGTPLALLQKHGVIANEALHKAETRLLEWNFLKIFDDAGMLQASSYVVTVELVRRWLIKRCPLRREIWELEKLDESLVHSIYEQAIKERQIGELLAALELFQQVLTINPNHFHALFELAELYFDIGDYSQAVELYTRAHKIDPVRNQEALERAKQSYANQGKQYNTFRGASSDIRGCNSESIFRLDLEKFYQAFNPSRPLLLEGALEQKYYIDFASVRGGKIAESLARTITRISPEAPTCQLLTGHIGCGKSTELLRLKAELEQQSFHVVYFESSYILDMVDVDLIDILLAIVEQVAESVKAINIRFESNYFNKLFGEINNFLQTPLGLELEGLSAGAAKITAKTKENPNRRRQLRDYLEPHTDNILQLLNQELLNINTQLKAKGKKGLVVIIDNLDRLDIHTLPSGRSLPEHIFIDHSEELRRINCHIVYTVPMSLVLSNDNALLQNRLGGGVAPRVLSMIPVRHRNGEINSVGLALMRQVVLARAFPDVSPDMSPVERLKLIKQIFDSHSTLDRLCLISGGHVRDLLGLVFECLREQDPPFERDTVEAVIRRYRDFRANPIDSQEWDLIFEVLEKQHIKDDVKYHTLLNSLFIFEYRDTDGSWFAIHPILAETKQFQSWLENKYN